MEAVERSSPLETYQEAYQVLQNLPADASLLDQLKPEAAATGDSFEVAKFLVVLLNEVRINFPHFLQDDYGLSMEENNHIATVLLYLEHPQRWDSFDSWPGILFPTSVTSPAKGSNTPMVFSFVCFC